MNLIRANLFIFIRILVVFFVCLLTFFFLKNLSLEDSGSNYILNSEKSPVFVSSFPGNFDNLELKDFPSSGSYGYAKSAVAYNNRIIVSSHNYLIEYTNDGQIVRVSDPSVFGCTNDWEPSLPAIITGDGNTVYAVCPGQALYEIDLAKNVIVASWDKEIPDLRNPELLIDGNNLWISTFNGLAKFNRTTREITLYNDEFGIKCLSYSTHTKAYDGDVWVILTANSDCPGGVAHYEPLNDDWDFFGVEFFNRTKLGRIDFNKFIVSANGIFAVHQDGGPEHVILDQFDEENSSWKRLDDQPYNNNYESRLPLREDYLTSYFDDFDTGVTWYVKNGDKWQVLSLPERQYLAVEILDSENYVLLSTVGIETYSRGQNFPEIVFSSQHYYREGRIYLSSPREFVVVWSDLINDYAGKTVETKITVYDLKNEAGFSKTIEDGISISTKDSSTITLEEDDNNILSLNEDGKTVLTIDVSKEEVVLQEE